MIIDMRCREQTWQVPRIIAIKLDFAYDSCREWTRFNFVVQIINDELFIRRMESYTRRELEARNGLCFHWFFFNFLGGRLVGYEYCKELASEMIPWIGFIFMLTKKDQMWGWSSWIYGRSFLNRKGQEGIYTRGRDWWNIYTATNFFWFPLFGLWSQSWFHFLLVNGWPLQSFTATWNIWGVHGCISNLIFISQTHSIITMHASFHLISYLWGWILLSISGNGLGSMKLLKFLSHGTFLKHAFVFRPQSTRLMMILFANYMF